MLRKLLHDQKASLELFFETIDLAAYETIVQMIVELEGALFFTGIGKSGFIAQKVAATFASLGFRAFYLNPQDALHGDVGAVKHTDIVFILSKTGQTEELFPLVEVIHQKQAVTVAMTCTLTNRLAAACDERLCAPCSKELCSLGLAPTTSMVALLLATDLLAVGCMEAVGIQENVFKLNHPGGLIGKRAGLQVKDVMLGEASLPLCFKQQSLKDVLTTFTDKRCGCLLVIDENRCLEGIFTDGDLRRALQQDSSSVLDKKMEQLMNSHPKTVQKQCSLTQCIMVMEDPKNPFMVLPVVDEKNKVLGLIKMHDIIQTGLTQPV